MQSSMFVLGPRSGELIFHSFQIPSPVSTSFHPPVPIMPMPIHQSPCVPKLRGCSLPTSVRLVLGSCLVLVVATTCTAQAPGSLPPLRTDTVTISGLSSGAFMAVQFEVAFSSLIRAAGIIAGGPYYCSAGSETGAFECMDDPSLINASQLAANLAGYAADGNIDSPDNLATHYVALFSGTLDSVVNPVSMKKLRSMYEHLGLSDGVNLNATFDVPAEHSWITSNYGATCSTLGSPFINNCGLDWAAGYLQAAFAWMSSSSSSRHQKAPRVSHGADLGAALVGANGHLFRVNQSRYGASPSGNSMSEHAYIYIPAQCLGAAAGTCHLHVAFHGCEQGVSYVGEDFVKHTQLNAWANTQGAVVLYPQVEANMLLGNPDGCYDWWCFTGADFAFKTGAQMNVVYEMVQALLAGSLQPIQPSTTTTAGPSPPTTSAQPGPPTTTASPSPNATCQGRPPLVSCIAAHHYIVCPAGMEFYCPGQCVNSFPAYCQE